MGNTYSMSHPPVFVSEPNLTPSDKKFGRAGNICCARPSDKKLGCGALYVCVYFAFASDSFAERAKGAEAAESVLLITNSPFGPSGLLGPLTPLQALL